MDDVADVGDPGKSLERSMWTPQSIETEQALLGAAILNPAAIQMVDGIITADDFSEQVHQYLWNLMVTAHAAGKLMDIKLMVSALGKDASVRIGSLTAGQYVARLAAEATTVINARDYAALIRDFADQRKLAAIGAGLRHETKIDPHALAAEAIERLDMIVAARTNTGTPGLSMREAVVRAVDDIASAYQRDGALSGYTWGLKDLDHKTLGLQRGELTILAGRPGMGKTALGLTTARKTAEAGNRVMFQSLEMRDQALTQRMIADLIFDDGGKPLPYWLLRSGRFREEDFARVKDASLRLAELPIRIEQRPALTVSQIAAQARQYKRRHGLSVLVIDHLHLVRASDRYMGNKVNEIGETTAGLKGLAKELDIAILALCQLSRGVESRDDKRPNLGDLRGSGDIEQDADTVVMLYREAYYLERAEPTPGSKESLDWMTKMETAHHKLQAIVEKQRNGPIGAVELFCDIACNAVRDRADADRMPDRVGDQQQLKGI